MDKVWPRVLDILQPQMKRNSFDNWFSADTIMGVARKGAEMEVFVSDEYAQAYMEQNFTPLVENALYTICGELLSVKFLDASSEEPDISGNSETEVTRQPPLFNPRYNFDSFVVGSSNRFAHAAAIAVSERPSRTYNPLFIYGGSGLGKTHLMHAIGQTVLRKTPHKKVAYVSTETFTNEFISLVRMGKAHNFKNRYRYTDIFLIDDIQFLTGKEGTQEEFFHTFNTLHEGGKQIVISSDRPPKEIKTLEERLRSRFEGGLITDIQPPDFETRCAILQRKAKDEPVRIDDEVIVYIATKVRTNIRELEGALNKIIYSADINNIKYVDAAEAQKMLRGMLPEEEKPRLTINLIQRIVSEHFQISADDMKSKKKDRYISHPRQVAMYLCREILGATQPQIGLNFGGRDHSTVIHACEKITASLQNNSQLQQDVEQIRKSLLG